MKIVTHNNTGHWSVQIRMDSATLVIEDGGVGGINRIGLCQQLMNAIIDLAPECKVAWLNRILGDTIGLQLIDSDDDQESDYRELSDFLIAENVRLTQKLDKALVDGKFCERQMRSAFEELADLRRKGGAI